MFAKAMVRRQDSCPTDIPADRHKLADINWLAGDRTSVTDDPAAMVREQWQGWVCNQRVVRDVDAAAFAPQLVGVFETVPKGW
jgi:hypothetical protein